MTFNLGGLKSRINGSVESNVRITQENFSITSPHNANCDSKFPAFSEFHSCLLSRYDSPEIALVGDSHSQQFYAPLSKIYPNLTILNISEYACLPFSSDSILNNNPVDCRKKIDDTLDFLSKNQAIKKIIVVGHYSLLATLHKSNEEGLKSFKENGLYFFSRLRDKKIYLLADYPNINYSACKRAAAFNKKTTQYSCEIGSRDLEKFQVTTKVIEEIANHFNNVTIFQTFDVLVGVSKDANCSVDINLFFDNNHLSFEGAKIVMNKFSTINPLDLN